MMLEDISSMTPPNGFEYTGEFRVPNNGEWFMSLMGRPVQASDEVHLTFKYEILEKLD